MEHVSINYLPGLPLCRSNRIYAACNSACGQAATTKARPNSWRLIDLPRLRCLLRTLRWAAETSLKSSARYLRLPAPALQPPTFTTDSIWSQGQVQFRHGRIKTPHVPTWAHSILSLISPHPRQELSAKSISPTSIPVVTRREKPSTSSPNGVIQSLIQSSLSEFRNVSWRRYKKDPHMRLRQR